MDLVFDAPIAEPDGPDCFAAKRLHRVPPYLDHDSELRRHSPTLAEDNGSSPTDASNPCPKPIGISRPSRLPRRAPHDNKDRRSRKVPLTARKRNGCTTGGGLGQRSSDKNAGVIDGSLRDAVDASWAEMLGCDKGLLRSPGIHVVRGGPGFAGYNAIYIARVDDAVLAHCPEHLRTVARQVLEGCEADEAFTSRTLERIAGDRLKVILGPSSHSFLDRHHFTPAPLEGQRVPADDARFAALRRECGEQEWAEAGFNFDRGVVYTLERNGKVVAAGNLTPFRTQFADIGLITHPDHRGRGIAKRLASRMIADALPAAGVVRYRALSANAPSIAVARSLGFVARGENLVARLREEAGE